MPDDLMKADIQAFTLIELLIVVAIIAILAAIAVPNFLEAQVRAKVSRVSADMRTMETALEMYRIDHGKAVIRNDNWNSSGSKRYVPDGNTKIYDPAEPEAKVGLRQLTTPLAYLASIPEDVFNEPMQQVINSGLPGASKALDYWDPAQVRAFRMNFNMGARPGEQGFGLLSVGPDRYMGGLNSNRPGYPTDQPGALQNTMRFFYDPSNGTLSYGNVYRFSAGLTQGQIFPMK